MFTIIIDLLSIYERLPLFLKNIVINIKGFQIYFRRYRGKFKDYKLMFQSTSRIQIQRNQFNEFLIEANKTTYWNKQFLGYLDSIQKDFVGRKVQKIFINI